MNKSSFCNLCLEILHTIWSNLHLLCALGSPRKGDALKERDEKKSVRFYLGQPIQ